MISPSHGRHVFTPNIPEDHRPGTDSAFSGGDAPLTGRRLVRRRGPSIILCLSAGARRRTLERRGPPVQLSVLAGTRSATLTGTFFPLEAKLQPPHPPTNKSFPNIWSDKRADRGPGAPCVDIQMYANIKRPRSKPQLRSSGTLSGAGRTPSRWRKRFSDGAGKEEGGGEVGGV